MNILFFLLIFTLLFIIIIVVIYIVNIGRFGISICIVDSLFGLDVMNYWFLYLSHLSFPLYYFLGWFESSLSSILSIVYIICSICFVILNMLLFIFYFEFSISIVLFGLLLKSYSSYRIKSSFLLFLYSSLSSLFFSLIAILYMWYLLLSYIFYLGFLFIVGLSIKVPIFPFHHWLTIVHSEASTSLSLVLAALILKLGIYAILRYILSSYYISISYYLSLLFSSSIVGIILPFLDLLIRLDYKILIALSSIMHMNMTSAALFSISLSGFAAGIIIGVSHGLNSISLFLFAGLIINKSLSHYIDSIWYISISYRWLLFIVLLSNISLPLSLSYIGEILVFYSITALSFSIT